MALNLQRSWKLFSRSKLLGTTTYFREQEDGTWEFRTEQDVESILENNKALATHDDGFNKSRDFQRVASIPSNIQGMWLQQYGVNVWDPNHADAVMRLLRDPDWRHLRTSPGNI